MQKPLILIVDDDPQNYKYLGKLLQESGYDIAIAVNGDRALSFLESEQPHLILLDIIMPGLGGYDLCRAIKDNPRTAGIPVIFSTALTGAGEMERAFDLGAVDYITKPFAPAVVKARVSAHIQLKQYNDSLEEMLRTRTTELEARNDDLRKLNSVMEVLLEKRQKDKETLEKTVLTNIKELVEPHLGQLIRTETSDRKRDLLQLIMMNVKEITASFTLKVTEKYLSLTPSEIQILNFIKHGYSTKMIAETMHISPRTVDNHRGSIRRKIGIKDPRTNLRTYLLTMD